MNGSSSLGAQIKILHKDIRKYGQSHCKYNECYRCPIHDACDRFYRVVHYFTVILDALDLWHDIRNNGGSQILRERIRVLMNEGTMK